MKDEVASDRQDETEAPTRRRRLLRFFGIGLIAVSVLLGFYLVVLLLGWQSGESLRTEMQQQQITEQLTRQVALAREDVDSGNYNLALRRLEWVLERAPNYEEAQALRLRAQEGLKIALTPGVTPSPTPRPLPTPTPGLIGDPDGELDRIRQLIDAETWPAAVSALSAFQIQFPNYERQQTDEMLFEAYINLGLMHIQGEQPELGIYYLEQAQKLGDLPQEALDYQLWAELYLQGMAYYGVNWNVAIPYFRDLCLAAPFYQNACDRLFEALVAFGDQNAAVQEWCPALSLYEEASLYGSGIGDKIGQAREGCLAATPTPEPGVITGTVPLTGTAPITPTE